MSTVTESSRTEPASPTSPSARPPRKFVRLALLTLTGLAVVVWIGRTALHVYHYVETDNAYVVGHLHQVSPQIDGQVSEVRVDDNQQVNAGDVLVRLDPLEFEIAVQKAEAALAQAGAQEKQVIAAEAESRASQVEARAKVAQAEAQIAQAQAQRALAKLTLDRSEQLFKSAGATTQADLDNSRSLASVAEANVTAASANRDAAEAAVESMTAALAATEAQSAAARAGVTAAKASVEDARRKLGYATITASGPGRIGSKNVEVGNRVLAGQAMLALVEADVWVVANFKETQLSRVRVGQEVELAVDALPDRTLHGKVDSFSPASGAQFALLPPDNATGNFNKVVQRIPVKIVLDAESRRAASDLRLGYSVVVNVRVR